MFRQEINLFKALEEPAVPTSLVSWQRFCWINYFFIGLFTLMFIFSLIHHQYLKSELTTAVMQNKNLETKFMDAKNKFPSLFFSQDIEKSVAQLQSDLTAQEKLLESISKRTTFSQYLTMLANLIVPQTWLTNITISNSGDSLNIKGESLNAASIQQFLNKLLSEKMLNNYTLNIKNISQATEDGKQTLQFEITAVKKS